MAKNLTVDVENPRLAENVIGNGCVHSLAHSLYKATREMDYSSKLVDDDDSSKYDYRSSKVDYDERNEGKDASDNSDDSDMDFFGSLHFLKSKLMTLNANQHPLIIDFRVLFGRHGVCLYDF